MKDIEVVSQVLVGSEHIFVWESHAAAAASRARNGVIVDGTPDALTVRGVNSNDPLSVLIVYSVMDAMRQAPQAYRVLSARTTAFEYALPVAGAPVVMQFDGALAGASRSAMAVSGTPAAEILRLYADTAEALRLRATDQFLAKFTPPSAEKMKQYLAAVTEAQYDALAELAWQKKHVQLVMGSDPVYIVYYTIGDDPEYRYNYVARDAATRQLRFANINRRWLLDHVLSRPELFDVSRVVGQQAPAAR